MLADPNPSPAPDGELEVTVTVTHVRRQYREFVGFQIGAEGHWTTTVTRQ
jgi:hypothetical protein